jgi:hypothetical protein
MRKFIIKSVLFIAPILLLFAWNEYYCRYQTTFGIKKEYLDNNSNSIEVLIPNANIN